MRHRYRSTSRNDKHSNQRRMALVAVSSLLIVSLVLAIVDRNKVHTTAHNDKTRAESSDLTPSVDQASNLSADSRLFVDPHSSAAQQAIEWRSSKPQQAAAMSKLASEPMARWLTTDDSLQSLGSYLSEARQAKATPVLVIYNIPDRDCGSYSAGGASSFDSYKQFINKLAGLVGSDQAILIIEPDALAGIDENMNDGQPCLTDHKRDQTYQAIRYATTTLKAQKGVKAYIDAGNSAWVQDTDQLADRLKKAGIDQADGFSLNVSNFQTTNNSERYGALLAARLNGKHFVIDTSRNGAGPYKNPVYDDFSWCNPPDRALGNHPTTNTGRPLTDAYLYIKIPGESDGQDPDRNKCFGGPTAGTWWPDYALGLVNRWPQELRQ